MTKQEILAYLDHKAPIFEKVGDDIWDYAETAFAEYRSAEALCNALEAEGFKVEKNVAGIETAFTGTYGSGHPVIGILGEFDALSGLSQKAGTDVQDPICAGAPGHGCGHNLLGAGSLAAASAVKEYLQKTGKSGTVIYYGTPGEEGGSGKAFMAREGVFDCLDCAITWHPDSNFGVMSGEYLANCQVLYSYEGIAAHAAGAPHLGRSALDAVELMNIGVQFLREHMVPEARIHYAITDAGGYSPNVVQPKASVLYLIRSTKNSEVAELKQRVDDIARGAALMTGTKVNIDFIKACSNTITNSVMEEILQKNLTELPLPEYTEEEIDFARRINESVPIAKGLSDSKRRRMTKEQIAEYNLHKDDPLKVYVTPYLPNEPGSGSTDVSDVSWVCPTAQINAMTIASKSPGHSWQIVAQGKYSTAHKGMIFAAKVLACSAIDIINDPDMLERAKEEHKEATDPGYVCPIPKGVKPRSISSLI